MRFAVRTAAARRAVPRRRGRDAVVVAHHVRPAVAVGREQPLQQRETEGWYTARPDKVRGEGVKRAGAVWCSRAGRWASRCYRSRSDRHRPVSSDVFPVRRRADAGADGQGHRDAASSPRVPPGDRDGGPLLRALGGAGERLSDDAALRDRVRADGEVGEGVRIARAGPDVHAGDGVVHPARGRSLGFFRASDRRVHGGDERHDRRRRRRGRAPAGSAGAGSRAAAAEGAAAGSW